MNKSIALTILISLITAIDSVAQTIRVQGKILNEELLPLPGAVIQTEDKKYYTLTDSKGKYDLEIPKQYKTIQILFVSYGREIVSLYQKDTVANLIMLRPIEEGFMSGKELEKENKRINRLYKQAEKIFEN